MKKISLLVLLCMILSLVFASCDMVNKGSDVNNNEPHEHVYGTTWSFDAVNHYHACTCGSQSDVAKHADGNNDGACDTCAIILDNEHVFDTAWTTDANNHWHAALCGHDVVDAKAPHTADAVGNCSVCGVKVSSITVDSVEDAIELALAQDYAAKAGTVFYHHMQYDYEYEYYYPVDAFSYFEKSEGYLHVLNLTESIETWYYAVGESVWSVVNNSGNVASNPNEYGVDNLNGYYFDGAILGYSEAAQAYGVADLMDALYFLGESAVIPVESQVAEDENGDVYYCYRFGVVYYAGIYLVNVAFSLDQTSYYVNNAYVAVASVEEGNGVVTEYETDENGDYVYDDNYDRIVKSVTLDENIEPDYSSYYVLTQGEENDSPASPEKDLVTSFEVKDADGNSVGDTVNVKKGTPLVLDILVSGGNISLDPIKAVVTDDEGNETWSMFANIEDGQVSINAYSEGTYLVTLASANYSVTLTVVVTAPDVEYIEVGVYSEDVWEYEAQTEITVPVNGTVDFKALVNSGADYTYTYEITGDTNGYSVEESWECHIATFTAAGTYTITLTSAADNTKTATLTVTVEEKEIDWANILTGTYKTVDSMVPITVVFNPADATSGTVSVSATHPRNGELSATFNYTVEGNTFTATAVEGGSTFFQNVFVNANGKVFVTADFFDYELAPYVESSAGDAVEVVGATDYTGEIPVLENETTTYVTTVIAYGMSYFQLNFDTTAYNVTINFDGGDDILCYSGSPLAPLMIQDGGNITIDGVNSSTLIFFESMNETENVEVTFTLTFTAI